MNRDGIQSLLDKAGENYNHGAYDVAIGLWRQVLNIDPDNQTASHGIRMASLLASHEEDAPPPRNRIPEPEKRIEEEEQVRARVYAGVVRIRELIAQGDLAAAKEGCELLERIAPHDPEVRRVASEVEAAGGHGEEVSVPPSGHSGGGEDPDVETLLARARSAIEQGRNPDAVAAAHKVLQADPGNIEACGILSQASEDGSDVVSLDGSTSDDDDIPALVDEPIPLDTREEEQGGASAASGGGGRSANGHGGEDPRIQKLIAEGHEAFDASRYQDAIEIWSRIFAIDESNYAAGKLIDKAKGALEEREREIEEKFYAGVDAREQGRLEDALGLFQQVKALSPTHAEAGMQIEEINAELAGKGDAIALDSKAAKEVKQKEEDGGEEETLFGGGAVPLAQTDETPPAPEPDPSSEIGSLPDGHFPDEDEFASSARVLAAGSSTSSLRPLIGAIAGALAFGAVAFGAYLWFGNNGSVSEAMATVPTEIHARPTTTPTPGNQGGPAAKDPVDKGNQPAQSTSPEVAPINSAERRLEAARLRTEGEGHFSRQDWALAVITLKQAREYDPLEFDLQGMLDDSIIALEKEAAFEKTMNLVKQYFSEGDYASALHKLYRLQQDYPNREPFDRYIRNAWYNWGVFLMQAGAIDDAIEKFDEVLDISSRDADADRAREIAKRYQGRKRDAAFDTFAATLPTRNMTQR